MIETSLYSTLAGDAAVTAIAGTRIYPMVRPQGEDQPAVVYQRVSTTPTTSLSGDSGLDSVRVQISCIAPTYAQAKSLGQAVRAAVSQSLPAVPEMEMDDMDQTTRTFRVVLDFRIWQR